MKKKYIFIGIAVIITITVIYISINSNMTSSSKEEKSNGKELTLEELKSKTMTTLGIRQDEAEKILLNFVSMIYAPTSDDDYQKALDNISEYTTQEEIQNIESQIVVGRKGAEIIESDIHYVSPEESEDGREREIIDIKVSEKDGENKMYLIEFIIRGGKIEDHKIWTY